jgi:micrococcal nuclease
MKLGVLIVVVLTAAAVWFWPELRLILAEQSWSRDMVVAIDDATENVPQVPPLRGPEAQARREFNGRVVAVADGDTFTLQTRDKRRIRVRLAEVDAPESAQPWGRRAKKALSSLIQSKAVRVVTMGRDSDGRMLGRVFVKEVDVNAEMVRLGSAHAYRAHLTDTSLIAMEEEARTAQRGLWSLRLAAVRPWDWRNKRAAPATASATATPAVATVEGCPGAARTAQDMPMLLQVAAVGASVGPQVSYATNIAAARAILR